MAEGEDKKRLVETMFDAIAPTYDALNHLLSLGIDRGWRRRVVRLAAASLRDAERRSNPVASATTMGGISSTDIAGGISSADVEDDISSPDTSAAASLRDAKRRSNPVTTTATTAGDVASAPAILDVATGTGDLAIALARRLPAARVTGVDISEGMLALGREKVAARALAGRVSLSVGDAERLRFADGAFDLVTVAFGVRNFGDVAAGLAEMRRVLRDGGRCLVLEFSEPRSGLFAALYMFYFHRVLPWVGRAVSRDGAAYSYLPRSVDAFPAPPRFAEMLREAGFAEVTPHRLTLGVAHIYEARNSCWQLYDKGNQVVTPFAAV